MERGFPDPVKSQTIDSALNRFAKSFLDKLNHIYSQMLKHIY